MITAPKHTAHDPILLSRRSAERSVFFIPSPSVKEKLQGRTIIQTNDVDLDYRGFIYITDRAGNGLHILEYTGAE